MKKLQNNFTTSEQSKRLLELGVPAWTADCRKLYWNDNLPAQQLDNCHWPKDYEIPKTKNGWFFPCWSVGRLIEIHETCTSCLFERRFPQISVLEDVLAQIAEDIIATDECWDFSKLED